MYEPLKIEESLSPAFENEENGETWPNKLETDDFLTEQESAGRKTPRQRRIPRPLIYGIIVVLWVLSLLVAVQISTRRALRYSFGNGFDTDLGKGKAQLALGLTD
jgi:hypothetical protein